MNLELVNRLIAHYKAMGPDEVANMHWGWGKCAGGVLLEWGVVSTRHADQIAAVLGIEYQAAYRMVYQVFQDGSMVVCHHLGKPTHAAAIAMLEHLAATGEVAWPDSAGNMR